ncbi:hypothetical protein QYE76_069180 [Lolium multiflorum]|uniref:Regulator of Vps4 activity in the MVB pathway protein n=1 Tax=Lolium multiflorum TaxID=4521 RepID=A0AAD8SI36_LOLMU|nr:hypothetical protein QYE76_069180 [Lolium multiflorum]
MGLLRKTSKQTAKLKSLLELAVTRIAVARRPRVARKSIASSDVGQLLALGHLDRALSRTEQVIQEDNMLEAFGIIELYCNRLIEQAAQLDKPQECNEELREAAASIMFAAGWCGDLPELLFARTILADKFGNDFAAAAKEGTDIVDPILVWKLSGNTTNMELKKKVTKEIAAESNILVDFSGIPEETEDILVDFSELQEVTDDGNSNVQELIDEMSCQDDMDGSSELEDDHQHSHRTNISGLESDENVQVITNFDGSDDEIKGQRSRKWWHLGCT